MTNAPFLEINVQQLRTHSTLSVVAMVLAVMMKELLYKTNQESCFKIPRNGIKNKIFSATC